MVPPPGSSEDFDPSDVQVIRLEFASFLKTRGFRLHDKDDLVQECTIRWLKARRRYSAERGASRTPYLKVVTRNVLEDLWKSEEALARRGHRTAVSLEHPLGLEDDDFATLGDLLPGRDALPEELAERSILIENVYRRLSPRQRDFMRGTLAGYSMTELARELGVHRDTLYEDRKRIQQAFRDEGLAPGNSDPTDRAPRS